MEEALSKILTKFHDNVDIFIKVISTFSFHYIYRLKFDCSCVSVQFCAVHLLVPCLVIWILLLAVDKRFFKSLVRFSQEKAARPVSFCKAANRLALTLCVSLIWAVSVLVDGDWFVCCSHGSFDNKTVDQAQEKALRTTSWIYGMYALLLISLFLLTMSSINAFLKDLRLFEMLLEEEDLAIEKHVREAMRNKAKTKLAPDVNSGNWTKVYNNCIEIHKFKPSDREKSADDKMQSDSEYQSSSSKAGTLIVQDLTSPLDALRRRQPKIEKDLLFEMLLEEEESAMERHMKEAVRNNTKTKLQSDQKSGKVYKIGTDIFKFKSLDKGKSTADKTQLESGYESSSSTYVTWQKPD